MISASVAQETMLLLSSVWFELTIVRCALLWEGWAVSRAVVYRLNRRPNGKGDQNGLAASGQNSMFKLGRCLPHTVQKESARFCMKGVSLTLCTL